MTSTLVTVVVGVLGSVLLIGRPAALPRPGASTAAPRARADLRGHPAVVVLVLGIAVGAGLVMLGALLLALLGGLVALVAAERRRGRRRGRRLATAERCEEYVMMVAAEMSAGRTPADALAAASSLETPAATEASRLSALGGDPSAALRQGAQTSGAGSLSHVAAAWQVAATTGAPLAEVVRRASLVVRDEVAAMREVEEQMAPVRATGLVLAALPLMGVLIGGGFGVNVPVLLLTTTWGQLCLLTALGLVAVGLWVIDRIGDRVARA